MSTIGLLEAELTGVLRVTPAEHAALVKACPEVRAPAVWGGLRVEIAEAEEVSGGHGSERQPPGASLGDHDPDWENRNDRA